MILICDLDGTLADCSERRKFMVGKKDWKAFYGGIANDKPNENIRHLIEHLHYHVYFVSGRPEDYREITETWLDDHGIQYVQLFMRKKGDFRPDDIVKREIFEKNFKLVPNERVLVLDDRDRVVKMWRELGLECWQVAEGDF